MSRSTQTHGKCRWPRKQTTCLVVKSCRYNSRRTWQMLLCFCESCPSTLPLHLSSLAAYWSPDRPGKALSPRSFGIVTTWIWRTSSRLIKNLTASYTGDRLDRCIASRVKLQPVPHTAAFPVPESTGWPWSCTRAPLRLWGESTNSLRGARSKGNGVITDEEYKYNVPVIIGAEGRCKRRLLWGTAGDAHSWQKTHICDWSHTQAAAVVYWWCNWWLKGKICVCSQNWVTAQVISSLENRLIRIAYIAGHLGLKCFHFPCTTLLLCERPNT
jgi:hypothetical protein